MSTVDVVWNYRHEWLHGMRVTLALCSVIWSAGLFLGALVGLAGGLWRGTVGQALRAAFYVLSAIPLLVVLFWAHYPLQMIFRVVVDPFATTAFTLALVNILLVGNLISGVIHDFPRQYVDAARVCGLSPWQTAVKVQFPIILRQILPGLLSIQIGMLQATLFASLISVEELFRVAQRINSEIYRPVEIYTALALFFLMICLPMHLLARWLRIRYTHEYSDR